MLIWIISLLQNEFKSVVYKMSIILYWSQIAKKRKIMTGCDALVENAMTEIEHMDIANILLHLKLWDHTAFTPCLSVYWLPLPDCLAGAPWGTLISCFVNNKGVHNSFHPYTCLPNGECLMSHHKIINIFLFTYTVVCPNDNRSHWLW